MMDMIDRLRDAVPERATDFVKDQLVSYGVRTADKRPLPDFLIVGTKRGGTTSLWNYLIEHPLVPRLFPAWNTKTSHYFEENWSHDEAWYRSHFPTKRFRSLLERRHGGPSRVGEAAPLYMYHPSAAERAHSTVPDVKLIVLLRDPVERAYSHWKERRTNQVEPLDFDEALEQEGERTKGERERLIADPSYVSTAHDWYSYRARGRYLEHLEPWLERFDRDQFMFIRSEDLYTEPARVYDDVVSFLGLPRHELLDFKVYNDRPSSPMDEDVRTELTEYYRPFNAALAERLGMTFDWSGSDV